MRIQRAGIQVVNGAPAPAGSQTTPAADVGWTPLYIVTLNAGQTTITPASVAIHPQAPFLAWTLPQLSPGFSRQVSFQSAGTFTWTAPAGVRAVKYRMWGAGGGGGGSSGSASAASGGGGGAYLEGVAAVLPNMSYSLEVGAGGQPGGAGTANPGTAGGNTAATFAGNPTAGGGQPGNGAANTSQLIAPGPSSANGGTFNFPGYPGGIGVQLTSTIMKGGEGGGTWEHCQHAQQL